MPAGRGEEFQARIVALIEGTRAIDIAEYERAEPERLRDELLPSVTFLAQDAVACLGEVLNGYDQPDAQDGVDGLPAEDDASDEFYLKIDVLMGGAGQPPVADLAFIARIEVQRKLGSLATALQGGPWLVIDTCGSCLRKIRKGLSAVESALCELEGLEPKTGFVDELASSLAVRLAYARFRREILQATIRDSMGARIQSVATSMAKLIGRDIYAELRIGDRMEIHNLQQRMIDWLCAGAGSDVRAGIRLWQDINGFASLLVEVNKRQELIEHDRAVIAVASRLLAEDRSAGIPSELLSVLSALRGRDDELDELLTLRAEPLRAEIEMILCRLGSGLSPASPTHADIELGAVLSGEGFAAA